MNCKQGDVAIVVNSLAGNEGKIIRVTVLRQAFNHPNGEPVWEYTGAVLAGTRGPVASAIADRFLRPIRDPGDDAKDEMLRSLPTRIEV